QNNRITSGIGYVYDADGRITQTGYPDDSAESTYDASGQLVRITTNSQTDIFRIYDGNQREVKRRTLRWRDNPYAQQPPFGNWTDDGATYYIRSSVMNNETLTEVNYSGAKIKTNVIANGAIIATQDNLYNSQQVNFNQTDASGMSVKTLNSNGDVNTYEGTEFSPAELDPLGNNVGLSTPYIELNNNPPSEMPNEFKLFDESQLMVNGQRLSCSLDGITVSCSMAMSALQSGAAAVCPNNDCGPRTYYNGSRYVLSSPFMAYGDGRSGFWINENDPNYRRSPDVDYGVGTRARFVETESGGLPFSWNASLFQTMAGFRFTTNNLEQCAVDVAGALEPLETDNRLGPDAGNWLEHIIRVGGRGGVYNVGTVAYAIATAYQETQNFTKIRETEASLRANSWKYSGGARYGAQGFVGLTHDYNYIEMGARLNPQNPDFLYNNPESASEPATAAEILFSFIINPPQRPRGVDTEVLGNGIDFSSQRKIVNDDVNNPVPRTRGFPKTNIGQRFDYVGRASVQALFHCLYY
ncbi:MAG: hypothetical protein ACR2N3_14895, partial [Pyrinomonadaceae bacterium]